MNKNPVNEITPQNKASFRNRAIVAIVMIATIIPAFILGGWVFFATVAIFLGLAIYEMITATGKKYPWYVWFFCYLIVYSFTYWFVIKNNFASLLEARAAQVPFVFSLEENFFSLDISVVGIGVAIGIFFLMGICGHSLTFDDVSYFLTLSIMLGLGFQAAFFVRYYPFYLYGHNSHFFDVPILLGLQGQQLVDNPLFKYALSGELLAFVVIGVTMNDTFAYVFGMLFGKHKLNEKVSPHKTWEGFFGGWAVGTLSALAFALPLTLCGFPMLPTLTSDSWYWIVLLAIVLPLLGDLGDLSFSFIKRHYSIKDYSHLLQGHGGMIDRVGSDLFGCIGTAIILIFITNGWNFFA
jgi:Predicted CDP-diglyceride synthetase/phosphatidate cytidylyltransferase